jgi:hypothetical protein
MQTEIEWRREITIGGNKRRLNEAKAREKEEKGVRERHPPDRRGVRSHPKAGRKKASNTEVVR